MRRPLEYCTIHDCYGKRREKRVIRTARTGERFIKHAGFTYPVYQDVMTGEWHCVRT